MGVPSWGWQSRELSSLGPKLQGNYNFPFSFSIIPCGWRYSYEYQKIWWCENFLIHVYTLWRKKWGFFLTTTILLLMEKLNYLDCLSLTQWRCVVDNQKWKHKIDTYKTFFIKSTFMFYMSTLNNYFNFHICLSGCLHPPCVGKLASTPITKCHK